MSLSDWSKSALRTSSNFRSKEGRVGWALLWLMGIPVPILLILFLLRGCT